MQEGKKKEGLSREAGQVGQPGKGEVLLAPSEFLYLVWLLDRLPEPDTLMLLSFISNSSNPHSGETSHLLSSWGDYLWKENATRPGWSSQTVLILISNSIKCHSEMYISVYCEFCLYRSFCPY